MNVIDSRDAPKIQLFGNCSGDDNYSLAAQFSNKALFQSVEQKEGKKRDNHTKSTFHEERGRLLFKSEMDSKTIKNPSQQGKDTLQAKKNNSQSPRSKRHDQRGKKTRKTKRMDYGRSKTDIGEVDCFTTPIHLPK